MLSDKDRGIWGEKLLKTIIAIVVRRLTPACDRYS
jgi:hypothetical protein